MEVGRGGRIVGIVSPVAFVDDLHVGCEREASRATPTLWPEELNRDKWREREEG